MQDLSNLKTTMSSLEIAELTGKSHKHVKTDIEKMLNELGLQLSDFSESIKNHLNQSVLVYNLPQDETTCLISGYSAVSRMRIIKRWRELENQSSKTLHHASPTIAACEIATVAFDFMSKFMDDKNMIAISASQAAYKETGVDVVKNSGVQLLAYDQQQLFTPTQLGEQLGLSAIKTNKLLAEKSLQAKVSGSWTLTDMGREFGTYLDTGKKRSDGTPVRQIKWKESVVSELEIPQKS